jgi:heme exporter protein C
MHRFASPARFARLIRALLPVVVTLTLALAAYGLHLGFAAPEDYQQGVTVRIMYLHVPAAWMATMIYGAMALLSALYLIFKHELAALMARELAAIGALFTAVTLLTGMIWGKPMWGTWWVWDARLTSVLILLFLYAGFMAVAGSGTGQEKAKVAASWLCIVGAVNLPIIKFSVEWWNTLHQPASILRMDGPTIDPSMLTPLFIMLAAAACLTVTLLFLRVEAALAEQKIRRLQIMKISHKDAAL